MILAAVLWLFHAVIELYIFIIFAMVIMSWLVAFNVVNPYNPFVRQVDSGLRALTNPVFAPLRRIIPSIGGLDITPVIVLLLLGFIDRMVPALIFSVLGYG